MLDELQVTESGMRSDFIEYSDRKSFNCRKLNALCGVGIVRLEPDRQIS